MRTIFALLSLILLVAIACSSDSGSESSSGTNSTAEPLAAGGSGSAATPTPIPGATSAPQSRSGSTKVVDGGTFLLLGTDPTTLDPHLTTDLGSAVYAVEIFGGLMTIDRDLAIVPDLAESWDVSPDGKLTTFRIRPDAKFHDGRSVTASDVKWSLERATDPITESFNASGFLGDIVGVREKLAGAATDISGVRVIDNLTVTIATLFPLQAHLPCEFRAGPGEC